MIMIIYNLCIFSDVLILLVGVKIFIIIKFLFWCCRIIRFVVFKVVVFIFG